MRYIVMMLVALSLAGPASAGRAASTSAMAPTIVGAVVGGASDSGEWKTADGWISMTWDEIQLRVPMLYCVYSEPAALGTRRCKQWSHDPRAVLAFRSKAGGVTLEYVGVSPGRSGEPVLIFYRISQKP